MQYLNKEFIGEFSWRWDTERKKLSVKPKIGQNKGSKMNYIKIYKYKKQQYLGTLSVQYVWMEVRKKTEWGGNIFRDEIMKIFKN